MSESVGQVQLDLILNSSQFQNQLSSTVNSALNSVNRNVGGSLTNSFKGLGKVMAGVFAVKGIVGFTNSCLELGSNLAEVQNVVDVTFSSMSESVDNFAKNAIETYGLSETVAKKYVGTFGAMAKAFGYSEAEAYQMSTTLTGLAGDVASFYNLSTDEAYTKLKSVFTGETESLKDLGIVMTQANLDQYALANGFGKTTAKMTEQEKVALRYQFVMQQLTLANGDFARTSDSWANQTRVLALRFDALKATLGQGFINLFTPIVKVINLVIAKLQVLAECFKSFTEWITGKKSDAGRSAGGVITDTADAVAGAGDKVADATKNASNATDKATQSAKKLKNELMGFDRITKLSDKDDSSDSANNNPSGSGSGAGGGLDIGGLSAVADAMEQQTNKMVSNVAKVLGELVDSFKSGFLDGIGENFTETLDAIKKSAQGIGTTLRNIFTDKEVINASLEWANAVTYNLGVMAGSTVSIGLTIAKNILGGIDKSLKENEQFIKNTIVQLFDISSRTMQIKGEFFKACAEIFSVFGGDSGISITADIVTMFTQAFGNALVLSAKFGADVLDAITKPIRDNKDSIKEAIENTLKPIATVVGTIKDSVVQSFSEVQAMYDKHISPLIQSIGDGISKVQKSLVDGYNKHIAPVLDKLADKFDTVYKNHIQPVISKIISLVGSLADGIKDIWEKVLVPCFDWIAKNIMPILAPIIEALGNTLLDTIGRIADTIGGFVTTLEGIIDFLVGVFTGNWEKAWKGVKKTFSGIWDSIKAMLNLPDIKVPKIGDIKKAIQDKWNDAKKWWDNCKGALKDVTANIYAKVATTWGQIKDKWHGLTSNISNKTASFFGKVGTSWGHIKNSWYNLTNNIKNKTASFMGKVSTPVSTIKNGWNKLSKEFKNKTVDFKVKLSTAVGSVKNFINDIIKAINKHVIAKLDFHIKAPAWLGGGSFGWTAPRIPMLAQGGYVKANTPQLAVIGDNRHQGEVVAPEDKLTEMALKASRMAREDGGSSQRLEALMETLINVVSNMNTSVYLDGESIKRNVVTRINNSTRATGRCEILV